jgi:hypothetical protein
MNWKRKKKSNQKSWLFKHYSGMIKAKKGISGTTVVCAQKFLFYAGWLISGFG